MNPSDTTTPPRAEPAPPGRPPAGGTAEPAASDRRVIMTVVGIQLAISLGYFAVMAHVVAHLRYDLGLLAGTITVVLAVRVALQNMLFLPAGALTDALGPARTGALACALRAVSFALLGIADGAGGLFLSAAVMAVGGALFHPAAQSALAGIAPPRRSRGFSAYVIAGQLAAIAGPPLGLALLSGGFGLLAAVTVAAWTAGAVLFLLLHRAAGLTPRTDARPDVRRFTEGITAVLRDRGFLRFALTAAPTTLLTSQVTTVVPLEEADSTMTTLFFCAVAAVTAAVQPWCGGRGERPWLLRGGLVCAGAGYLVLLATPSDDHGRIAVLMAAAALHGSAAGLTQSALFQITARCAPPRRFGVYLGLSSFLSGTASLVGGFVLGSLLDGGSRGMTAALAVLALTAAASAAVLRTPPAPAGG